LYTRIGVPCVTPTLDPNTVNEVVADVAKVVEACRRCCPPECAEVWDCQKVLEECNAPGRRGRRPERCHRCQELWDKYAELCNSCQRDCPPECSNIRATVVGWLARAAVAYAADVDTLAVAKAVEGAYELLHGQVWAAVASKALREWVEEVRRAPLYNGRYYPPPECCAAALSLSYMLGALVRDPRAHGLVNAIRAELVAGLCTVPRESLWAAEALLSYIFATAAV